MRRPLPGAAWARTTASSCSSSPSASPSTVRDVVEDAALGGMHVSVGVGRLQLDLDEEAREIEAVAALPPELGEDIVEGKAGSPARVEEVTAPPRASDRAGRAGP